MMQPPPFTLTNESITVVWEGKPHTVQKGSPQYIALRKAILEENWDAIPKNLTVAKSLNTWAQGRFTLKGDSFSYDDKPVPADINRRIIQMATKGEDPGPLFKFWERLQKNPSFRSVNQLWGFLQHQGIPLTEDGCILAYKSVRPDYLDHHSGKFLNKPGTVHKMPRNEISDDPQVACHDGFHVGALGYAGGFGGSDRRIVITKVDPEHVVCVPYDSSQQKMRVCEYLVFGNHNGEHLPSTTFKEDVIPEPPEVETEAEAEADNEAEDLHETAEGSSPEVEKRQSNKGYAKFDKMGMEELMNQSIEDLRRYAGKGLDIVGASKIPGGKSALVARILEVRE